MKGIEVKGTSVLKQVFDGYIEDTVTDEQVQRVLEPVLRLIRDGAFNRPRRIFGQGSRIWSRPVEFFVSKTSHRL